MPIVRAIGEGLAGDRITRIVAILNGTTNAVLSQMEATGCTLDGGARRGAGAAATRKRIRPPISTATTRAPSWRSCARSRSGCASIRRSIDVRSSRRSAPPTSRERGRRGATIRQIALRRLRPRRGRRSPRGSRRSSVDARARSSRRPTGPQNAALITGEHSGEIGIFGAGAGGDATAVAVLGDIAAIARDQGRRSSRRRHLTRNFRLSDSDFTIERFPAAEAV